MLNNYLLDSIFCPAYTPFMEKDKRPLTVVHRSGKALWLTIGALICCAVLIYLAATSRAPNDMVMETFCYFLFTLLFAAVLLVAVALVLLTYGNIARTKAPLNTLRRFVLLLGAVTIVGWPLDFLWMLLFSGRWYLDKDHVYGFSPLIPFQLDTQCGDQFIGYGSYVTIEAAWLAFAVVGWFIAVKFVQKISSRKTA